MVWRYSVPGRPRTAEGNRLLPVVSLFLRASTAQTGQGTHFNCFPFSKPSSASLLQSSPTGRARLGPRLPACLWEGKVEEPQDTRRGGAGPWSGAE